MAILFLGLFLRVYDLSDESVWYDEAFSIELANSSISGVINGSAQDIHPPLYHILLHYWINLFGDSEFSTRFMSVVFGVFAIFMIYKVGSLILDEEAGILSALLLALSSFHIYYSQEARMYSLMALLTLLSMYFFLKILRNRNVIDVVGYVLSSTFLIYTHYFGLFIILAQNIYIFTLFLLKEDDYKQTFKRWVPLQLILIALFSPWIIV
ncbi:MAG: glycosyltransferase family 39 protein, partial [Thermodesulfobacteriota bacterium]